MLVGGWAAKMGAVAIYSLLAGGYLRWLERPAGRRAAATRISDVFDLLTYRERYEDLLARTGRDALTGAFDRGRLETQGRRVIDEAARTGRPASLLLIDIDHFKSFNDRFGHAAGDVVLRRIARDIMATVRCVRSGVPLRRRGVRGDRRGARGRACARARRAHPARDRGEHRGPGALARHGQRRHRHLRRGRRRLRRAVPDRRPRLYQAKAAGRNCVIGERPVAIETPVRLAYTG